MALGSQLFGRFRVVLLLCGLCAGCGLSTSAPSTRAASGPASQPQVPLAPAEEPRLAPLTREEQAYKKTLINYVEQLSGKIGERNSAKVWELADASDYIAGQMESLGLPVQRQGFETGEIAAQNLEVRLPGGVHGKQIVVVGAHYDSAVGSPGADDNASGVAAVLALAERFRDKKLDRSLRFVAFAQGNERAFGTELMGSLVYAKRAVAEGQEVVAMLSLDSLGRYSQASQPALSGAEPPLPARQDFVAVLGNAESRLLTERVGQLLRKHLTLPAHAFTLSHDSAEPTAGEVSASDQWAFWKVGLQAVLITDLFALRQGQASLADDKSNGLDFDSLARVVTALEATIGALCASEAEKPAAGAPREEADASSLRPFENAVK